MISHLHPDCACTHRPGDPCDTTCPVHWSPYKAACQRFENISRNYEMLADAAGAIAAWANDEYVNAQDGLRQYEVKPGIPKPEYRGYDDIDDPEWPDGAPIPFDVAKAALQARLTDV